MRKLLTKAELQDSIKKYIELTNTLDVPLGGQATGELGEQYARLYYNIDLVEKRNEKDVDAYTKDGETVQIKTHSFASARKTINFPINKTDYVLILYLKENGEFEEIYNGSWEQVNNNFEFHKMQNTNVSAINRSKISKFNTHSIKLREEK